MIVDLETISPVHIGNGNDISPMEYLVGDFFMRIDLDSLVRDEAFDAHYETYLKGAASSRYIGQYVPPRLLAGHAAYKVPFTSEARGHLKTNPIQVKEYFKSAGRVLIPGSSVKGAIFSALLFEVLNDLWREGSSKYKIEKILRKKDDRSLYNELLDLAFSFFSAPSSTGQKNRFFHWINVSDSSLGSPEQNLRVFFTKVDGAKGNSTLPVICEALDTGKKFRLEINQADGFRWSVEEILVIVDRFYRLIWKKCYGNQPVPREGSLIRIGQGSSAYSTSLLLFAETNRIGQDIYRFLPPRTSKKVEGDGNLGWVILTASPEKHFFQTPTEDPNAASDAPEEVSSEMAKEDNSEQWKGAVLTYEPGSQTLTAAFEKKKAFAKRKESIMELIPEKFQGKIFGKNRKAVKACVTVNPRSFQILKIEIPN